MELIQPLQAIRAKSIHLLKLSFKIAWIREFRSACRLLQIYKACHRDFDYAHG